MTSFGILQRSLKHEQNYVDRLGKAGNASGFCIYRFSPDQVPAPLLNGVVYDPSVKTWRKAQFPVPDFIYDRCFYSTDHKQPSTVAFIHWLKNKTNATFLGYGLPGKWAIYKYLSADPFIRNYLPKTSKLQPHTGANIINKLLNEQKKLMLKPIIGSQGNGMLHITKDFHTINVRINHKGNVLHHTYDTTNSFLRFVSRILNQRDYMAQELLSLLDENNRPFDRRVVMKKISKNCWSELGRAMRVGKQHSFVSNLHSGGIIQNDDQIALKRSILLDADVTITRITHKIVTLLEEAYPPLFELGLDFGIDHSGKVWLLEVNSKPGHQILQDRIDYPALPFLYCRSLLAEKKGVKRHDETSTIEKG
ncbi:MAG: YheC/YheD family protein [Anaerobacillus sp.]